MSTTVPLSSLCNLINGRAFKQSEWGEDGLPIIRIQNLNDETKGFNYYSGAYERKHEVNPGDLLFSWSGTPGSSFGAFFWRRAKGLLNQHIFNVVADESKVCKPYLRYALNHLLDEIIDRAHGAVGLQHITKSQLNDIPIPLPSLPEQKRIAAILDAADALRAKRQESIEQLDLLMQATFLEMFGDPVTNPKEWNDNVTLGEVADITSGLTKGRKLRNQTTREVPYLAVVNVQDRHLVLDPLKTIEATDVEIEKYRLLRNDLLLTEGGDRDKLGRGTLWQGELPECIHQNHIFRVRLHDERLMPVFLNWLVGSDRGKRYFLGQAKQTTGIASINLSQLKRFPLLLPPFHLQQRFASIVEAVESHKVRLKTQYAELESLFASLQVQAFSGVLCSVPTSRQHASA